MASKYELTISTKYVPDWTYVEAIREIFQNAIDNEITNTGNKMEFSYENGVVRVSNKTSVLKVESLLLGSSTKSDDKNTIGQHGEGYKIAFMVLLREGKQVKVYNYGNKEIWSTKLVKSKRFNGELVPTVIVEKEAFWKDMPDSDLTIEIAGITEAEYLEITKKNLHLRDNVNCIETDSYGRILTDTEEESGNIYVKGLFVCNNKTLRYGYDFAPNIIQLDRDRKLVGDFNLKWNTALILNAAFRIGRLRDEVIDMIENDIADATYVSDINKDEELSSLVVSSFISSFGERSTPVSSTIEMDLAIKQGLKPVIVNSNTLKIISRTINNVAKFEVKTLAEKFEELLDSIESKLTDEEVETFQSLISEL